LQLAVLVLCGWTALAQSVFVTTQHNDNARTGANLQEWVLTTCKVEGTCNADGKKFGKLFELAVDGDIYSQPLYVQGVNTPKGPKNVVFVATMHNTVYAFDADQKGDGKPIWAQPLEPAVQLDGNGDFCQNVRDVVQKEIGIIGTPVISTSLGALYVVTFTGGTPQSGYRYFLHALDIGTGREKFGGPKLIAEDGFNSYLQMQRAALLLSNNIVYVAFGSFGDCNDDAKKVAFHGWLFGFDAVSLARLRAVFNTTKNAGQGGIWQAGQGPAADATGNIYLISGNGDFDKTNPPSSVGNSFIKLGQGLNFIDRFTPWNSKYLSDNDLDLGSGGALLLPSTDLLVGGGKEGKLYLLRRTDLGGFSFSEEDEKKRIVQSFTGTREQCKNWDRDAFPDNNCGDLSPAKNSQGGYYHIHGSPVYWNGTEGPFLYVWGEADKLRRFRFVNGKFDSDHPIESAVTTPTRSMPGGVLSLSANGANRAAPAILWATHPTGCVPGPGDDRTDPAKWCDTNVGVFPGTLRAIDASTLRELWNSDQNPDPIDRLGYVAKFTPPTVANGRVYVATFADPRVRDCKIDACKAKLVVYGLKNETTARRKQ
jgi:hypothetical protein